MKWSFSSLGIIILGLFGILVILLFNDITVSNEQDFFTLREATEGAMLDAVDVAYYRITGDIKISKEKFAESLIQRFSNSATFGSGNYEIRIFQVIECPAKASVGIYDATSGYNIYTYTSNVGETKINIVNELSGILETENDVQRCLRNKDCS